MAELDPGVLAGTINANFKTIAETPSLVANSMNQSMADHHNRLRMIAESSVGQVLNKMNGLDPTEAASIAGVNRSDLSKELAALGAAVAGIQQQLKGAQTSLPETGQG